MEPPGFSPGDVPGAKAPGLHETHCRLAQLFASWVDADPDWERVAPVPFSVVCFRAIKNAPVEPGQVPKLDILNHAIIEHVNKSGDVFISHTSLNGHIVIRLAIGNLRTEERHLRRAWDLLREGLRTASQV